MRDQNGTKLIFERPKRYYTLYYVFVGIEVELNGQVPLVKYKKKKLVAYNHLVHLVDIANGVVMKLAVYKQHGLHLRKKFVYAIYLVNELSHSLSLGLTIK